MLQLNNLRIRIANDETSPSQVGWEGLSLTNQVQAFAIPLQTVLRSPAIKRAENDNRINNRTLFKYLGHSDYSYAWLEKSTIRAFSGVYSDAALGKKCETAFASTVSSDSWFENVSEHKAIQKSRLVLRDGVNKIRSFALLKEDWDSYGAKKISLSTIVNAIVVFTSVVFKKPNMPQPFISPSPDGGINFEWETCSSTLSHLITESLENIYPYVVCDRSSGDVKRFSGEAKNIQDLIEHVLSWAEGIMVSW